jgi:hypothetical protein
MTGPQNDDCDQCQDRSNNSDNNDVAVAFTVCRPANGKQRNDCPIVGQAIQGACPDDRDAVQQSRVET